MGEDKKKEDSSVPDSVYAGPERARRAAQNALAQHSSDRSRAVAAITLGRSAYYDNRIEDSISLLEGALQADLEQSDRDEAELILAPALSKVGRTDEALRLLEQLKASRSDTVQAKALNQRGAILVEQGEYANALDSFTQSAAAHRRIGDIAGEGRAVLNMGAAASEIGDHDASERHYEEAWRLNLDAGQAVMCAMIEGNLGYVASRKGDFAAALAWYERGRTSFSELGDVELLQAVLEVDHATTLLDIGMHESARSAAEFAQRSSATGENRNLAVQAEILLAEALLGLGQSELAAQQLRATAPRADQLGLRAWTLRAEQLLLRVRTDPTAEDDPPKAEDFLDIADGMVSAGWNREALRTVATGAAWCASIGDIAGVTNLQSWANESRLPHVDPLDRHVLDAAVACVADDRGALDHALHAGFNELDRVRHLVGSAELRSRLGSRALEFRELALDSVLREGNGQMVKEIYNKTRLTPSVARSNAKVARYRSELRDLRVRRQESRLSGGSSSTLEANMATLEEKLARLLKDESGQLPADPSGLAPTPLTRVTLLSHRGHLFAVVDGDEGDRLVELGEVSSAAQLIRAQRSALRRLTVDDSDRSLQRNEATSQRLDELLILPLGLDSGSALAIFPEQTTSAISWSALPSLKQSQLLIGTEAGLRRQAPVAISSMAALDGGSLAHGPAEVQSIESIWTHHLKLSSSTVACTASLAASELSTNDLVHIAAHGEFRTDNAFMSSLEFSGEHLAISQLETTTTLPSVVVLASCDGGASTSIGVEIVGTTEALLAQGVRIVIAPNTIVDDAASARFAVDLHNALAAGLSPVEATVTAQQAALDRGSGADIAVASVFSTYGVDDAAFKPLQISRI